jgi:hypothetical protein
MFMTLSRKNIDDIVRNNLIISRSYQKITLKIVSSEGLLNFISFRLERQVFFALLAYSLLTSVKNVAIDPSQGSLVPGG